MRLGGADLAHLGANLGELTIIEPGGLLEEELKGYIKVIGAGGEKMVNEVRMGGGHGRRAYRAFPVVEAVSLSLIQGYDSNLQSMSSPLDGRDRTSQRA